MSLRVEEGGRELLRVEVLDVKSNGEAKFRLWYHKWSETRPDRPYVDVELTYKGERQGFTGRVFANKRKGIYKEHLAEIADLLRRRGVEGVAYYEYEKSALLQFTGAFRDSLLAKVGIKPELPPGKPPAVQHLGSLRFKVDDREVEFGDGLYAKLELPSRDDAERFASSLKAIGIFAEVAGNTVKLNRDSFFGLLAATNAVPPGLTPLYRSEEGDFRVYAAVEGGRLRFYFAVKHEGAWRVTEGLYDEKSNGIQLWRAEREVLEALRDAVARALEKLAREQQDHPAKVEEPREKRDKNGNVVGYYLYLYGPHITPYLKHAAERVRTKPAEVRLEGRRVKIGGVEATVEFKLLKGKETVNLLADDVEQTLALYKSLRALGVPVEITPEGVKVDGEAMWALVAAAVEKAVEKDGLGGLPAEVMPDVELLKVYNVGDMKMYIFRAEGAHYYFTVKTGQKWRATGGKHTKLQVKIAGKAAPTIAEAINAIYREMGMDRRVEVRHDKRYNAPYIQLTNIDLELLGLKQP